MAMYQAAVSKQDTPGFSNGALKEDDVCSVPGGLASIRRQFESEEKSSTCTVMQFHSTQRSMQVSHQVVHKEVASSVENHHGENEEEEYYPKLSAKELARQFEKTIEEAAPNKKIKIPVPKSELCTVCRTRVYPMEGLIADRKKFHKSCFLCEHCKNKLSLGNYVSLHGHLYCPPHYKQLFTSKGHFDEGFGQRSSKELLSGGNLMNAISDDYDWRYSLSQSTVSSVSDIYEKESKVQEKSDKTPQKLNKHCLLWPPHADPPKRTLTMDQDIQLVKPLWPPKSEASKSPKPQRRKSSQIITLHP